MLNDERDTAALAKALGLEKVYDLSYRNHNLDEINIKELTARFVFLIRLLKIVLRRRSAGISPASRPSPVLNTDPL